MTWREASPPLRTLGRWLTIVQVIGYTVAVLNVHNTTGLTPAGAARRYRGSDSAADSTQEAMQFPKPLGELLVSTHTHVLAMAAMFALSGACFALCGWPSERWRRFLIAEPFAAIVVSFGAIWLMRWVHPGFAWLLFASSMSAAAVFYFQAFVILRETRDP